jgi:hypothetical protein
MKFTSSFVALLFSISVNCAPLAAPAGPADIALSHASAGREHPPAQIQAARTPLNAQIRAGAPLRHVESNPRPQGNGIINTSERLQGQANSLQRGMTNRASDTFNSNRASLAKQNQLAGSGDLNGAIREAHNQVMHGTFQKAYTAVDHAQKGALQDAAQMAKARGD